MIIEVTGVGFHNRGAELMLRAIVEHFAPHGDRVRLATRPLGTFQQRAELRLLQVLPRFGLGRSWLASQIMSRSFRKCYGLVREADVDAVLDASGFAYSDQWGPGPSEALARTAARWKAQRKKVVLLPQAFGPFDEARVRNAFQIATRHVDLAFARDRESFDHLRSIAGDHPGIRRAPDFTNLVAGQLPDDFHENGAFACIVPNCRMTDKTEHGIRQQYVRFMALCIGELKDRQVEPVFLLHTDREDRPLISRIEVQAGSRLRQLGGRTAAHLKATLARSRLVVGSRFHALVSALSQGVPCLATGWSHKYEQLLRDYDMEDLLASPTDPPEKVLGLIRRILEEPTRSEIIARLQKAGELQRQAVRGMWDEIDRLLGLAG